MRKIQLTESDIKHIVLEAKRRILSEAIEELDLYHGTQADFDKFDLAYLSSGFGQQAYGFGVYLTDNKECAREYSGGGMIYTTKVPDGPYLSYDGIKKADAQRIAKKFFKYYTTENEYGKEAYAGFENEFWNEECKYIADSQNGGDVYGTIASILGSDKETSEFLNGLGYKGLTWFNTTINGSKSYCYLIFNADDIEIVSKSRV